MKYFSKQFKVFVLVLIVAIVFGVSIAAVSYGVYGKVYFFNGFTITKILWIITMILGLVGSVGTIVCGISDLSKISKGKPANAPAGGQPAVNEQVSQTAQYEFNKRLEACRAAGTTITEQTEAAIFAQAVELQMLKAPASAVFCPIEATTVTYENGMYVVSGYVDSQNSYGAMIRTPYRFTLMKVGGVWKSMDTFVSTSAGIATSVAASVAVYWIFGIIIAVILTALSFFIFKAVL